MKVGSLFAGIGGFDLGLERAGFEIAWQVEIDPYCQRVLAKHWPHVQRYGDIRAIDWATVPKVDMLCGGFPCQDLSFAGKRAGIDGERSGLWSEYVRAIRALRPRFIIVENVPGLLTNEYMGRVLGDLAASGYDAEWDCLPASAFGAPHRRDRVWILAYPFGIMADAQCLRWCARFNSDIASRHGVSGNGQACQEEGWRGIPCQVNGNGGGEDVADADSAGLEKRDRFNDQGRTCATIDRCDWWATEPAVGELVDGVSGGLVRFAGRTAKGIPQRTEKLKGLGNAIVPQIAEWLGRQIMKVNL